MPNHPGDAAGHCIAAQRSFDEFNRGLSAFRVELQRGDWAAAEAERLKTVSALESYLDHLMSGTRIVSDNAS